MKKTLFGFGIAIGLLTSASTQLGGLLPDSLRFLEWLSYLIMIVAMALIFVAVKRHRDRQLGGVIRFGTALSLGLGITFVASLIYVFFWEVGLRLTDFAFIHEYTEAALAGRRAAGATPEELATLTAQLERLEARYLDPLFRLPTTFLEIFPVGLVATLLTALLLRQRKPSSLGWWNRLRSAGKSDQGTSRL